MSVLSTLRVLIKAENVEQTNRQLESIDRHGAKAARSMDQLEKRFSHLDNTVGDFNRVMLGAGNAVKLVKFPALIAGAGLAAQAVGALAAGTVSLGAALAPLIGLAGAAAAGYAAMGQALLTIKLTQLDRIGQALTGNSAAMKSLTPAARQFVRSIRGEVGPAFADLRKTVQGNLFGQLTSALPTVRGLLGTLTPVIGRTATTLGRLADNALRVAGSRGVLHDLATIGNTNIGIISHLGSAGIVLARALVSVVAAAGPLTLWLARSAQNAANFIARQVQIARESGRMATFFDRTRAVLVQLWNIARDVGVALFNIARAGAPLGGDLLTAIEKLAARFRDWTESTRGRNAIAQYFRDARGPIMAIAGLVGSLGGAFLRLSRPGGGLAPFVDQLQKAVPVIEGVISSTTASLGPALAAAAPNIVRLIGAFAGSSGPLTLFISLIGSVAGVLATLLENNPALNTFIVTLLGLKSVVGILTPFAAGIYSVAASMLALETSTLLIGGGLALLAAALVVAYLKFQPFHDAVNATAGAIRDAFNSAVVWVTQATNTVVGEVSQWDVLFSAIRRGLDFVAASARLFFSALTVIFRLGMLALAPVLTAGWVLIRSVFTAGFNAVKGIVTGGFQVLRGVVKILGGLFKGDFGQMWNGVKDIFKGAITATVAILSAAWAVMKAPVQAIAAGLHDAFSNTWGRIKSLFRSSINTVIDYLNLLIKGLNAIPFVPDIGTIKRIGAGGGGGGGGPTAQNLQAAGFAKGGAYGRTGGRVDQPMVFMGEEAPMHPEFVIPTNPAYRGQAMKLLAQAAGQIGMAQGGVWSKGELVDLWHRVNDGLGDANLMAAIALAESGGRQGIVNGIGAGGLWQINPPEPNYLDPTTNARIAGRKLRTQGLGAWEAYTNGSYRQYVGGGGGLFASIGNAIGSAIGTLADAVGNLPGVPRNLGIFQGVGKWVLDKARGYVGKLFGGAGGIPGGVSGNVQDAIRIAASLGFAHPSAGQLTSGGHVAGSYHYQGRAADFGAAGHTVGQMSALFNTFRQHFGAHLLELFYDPIGYYIKNGARVAGAIGGHSDHLHIALARGGRWGGYKRGTGGAARGMALVGERGPELVNFRGGEQVIPHRDSMKMIGDGGVGGYASGTGHTGAVAAARAAASKKAAKQAAAIARRQAAADHATAARIARQRVGHALNPQNPADVLYARIHGIPIAPTKGLSAAQIASTGGGGAGGDDPNQGLIDAQNAAAAAAEAQAAAADALRQQVAELQKSIDDNTAFAQGVTATDNYQLSKAFADFVSGQIAGYGIAGRKLMPGNGSDWRIG
jgi:hypothetical protein